MEKEKKVTFEEMFDALVQGLTEINADIRVYDDASGEKLLVTYYDSYIQETYVCDDEKEVILGHICPWIIRRKNVTKDEDVPLLKEDVEDLFEHYDEDEVTTAFLNTVNHNEWPKRANVTHHIAIPSKHLAQKCEDPYEEICFAAVCNMFKSIANLSEELTEKDVQTFKDTLSSRFINDDFHHEFKKLAYKLFLKLGYSIESDGTF